MSTIQNYQNELARQQSQRDEEQREQRNRAVFAQLLERHGLLASWEANFRMLVDFCNGELTLEGAEFLLNNPPDGFELGFKDEREDWIEKIIELLRDPTERRFTKYDEVAERKRLAYKSRTELMARHNELVLKQTLAQKPLYEVKADLAAHRKAVEGERPFPGYPTLLSTIVPRGEVQARNTRDYLNDIARTDIASFKRMATIYGSQQLTAIMQGKRY